VWALSKGASDGEGTFDWGAGDGGTLDRGGGCHTLCRFFAFGGTNITNVHTDSYLITEYVRGLCERVEIR